MPAPEGEIRRLGIEDVSESGVAGVTRSREEGIIAMNLFREEDAVAVIWQQEVLSLNEGLEVLGFGQADRRAMVTIAPCHIVGVSELHDAGVIAIDPFSDLFVFAAEFNRLGIDLPVETVIAEGRMEGHAAILIIDPEDAGETALERHHRAIENTIGIREKVAPYNRIPGVSPQWIIAA
jgi:hypothetical protein